MKVHAGGILQDSDVLRAISDPTTFVWGNRPHLTELPEQLSWLGLTLEEVDLKGCVNLLHLPESFGLLSVLKRLILSHCVLLSRLPDSIGGCIELINLDMDGCAAISSLPGSLGKLYKLQRLILADCKQLECLPETLNGCTSLDSMNLSGCSALTSLPDAICRCGALKKLVLKGCAKIEQLPREIALLPLLHLIDLDHCESLVELPESIASAPSLSLLSLQHCVALRALPQFAPHQVPSQIYLFGCISLAKLTDAQLTIIIGHTEQYSLPPSNSECSVAYTWAENLGQLTFGTFSGSHFMLPINAGATPESGFGASPGSVVTAEQRDMLTRFTAQKGYCLQDLVAGGLLQVLIQD